MLPWLKTAQSNAGDFHHDACDRRDPVAAAVSPFALDSEH
jgi:hypothetical protein